MTQIEHELDVSQANAQQKSDILKYAADVRKFKIEKFWQRSLFFWGFIAAAFVAYAALYAKDDLLTLFIACFGLVCSFAWTLQNRGGKYWQEAWEQKVESVEVAVLGAPLFSNPERRKRKGLWGASRFSVSRLTIALSDFTVIVWMALAARVAARLLLLPDLCDINWFALTALVVTALYVTLLLVCGRTKLDKEA
jgi:hypothetical protein